MGLLRGRGGLVHVQWGICRVKLLISLKHEGGSEAKHKGITVNDLKKTEQNKNLTMNDMYFFQLKKNEMVAGDETDSMFTH